MKKYTSNYNIKNLVEQNVMPKYFDNSVKDAYNVGLIGMVTDIFANSTEDMFNIIPTLMNEMFPNLSKFPETIYNNAALFQEEDLLATAATLNVVLLVNVEDILKYNKPVGAFYEFMIGEDNIIDVEGQYFRLDYDIKITVKPYRGSNIFTASYVTDYHNSISDVVNPFIRSHKIIYNRTEYLAMSVKVRRVSVFEERFHIINNDKINMPILNFKYRDQLTNFEVFYKSPSDPNTVQLKKKLLYTKNIREPFCFFRLKDNETVEISFSNRETYFKPEFNSEIYIRYWTTNGAEGNFNMYTGEHVYVINGIKYEYNKKVPFIVTVQSASVGGASALSLESLHSKVADNFSTVKSYTTDNDLQLYFNSFKYKYDQDVFIIKKRDDIFDRLYTSFSLLKDSDGNYFKTNTLDIEITPDQFDVEYEQSDRYILKPGRIMKYKGESRQLMYMTNDNIKNMEYDTDEFIFTNPFLMTVSKKGIVGYYLNTTNSDIVMDYSYINSESLVQFICSNLYIVRNPIDGDEYYTIKLFLHASDEDLENPLTDEEGNDTGRISIKLTFKDRSGEEFCFIDTELTSYDMKSKVYEFTGKLHTDDYITVTQSIRINNIRRFTTGETYTTLIPMNDLDISIYSFFKYDDYKRPHKFDHIDNLSEYTLTNIFTTGEKKANLILTLSFLKSNMKYVYDKDRESYKIYIKQMPVTKAQDALNYERYMYMIYILVNQYNWTDHLLDKKTNNFSIDMKFVNTYGRSKNFVIDETEKLLNSVNCKLKFRVAYHSIVDPVVMIDDIKRFIKDYFEDINGELMKGFYISNLIQQIENNFDEVKYIKFISMNDMGPYVQNIDNVTLDVSQLSKEERINFVPEFLNIDFEDIVIELID